MTEEAVTTSNGKGHYHPITLLQIIHCRTRFNDLTHKLMPHNIPGLHSPHQAVIKVQVGATTGRRSDFNDCVTWCFNLGISYLFNPYILSPVPGQCFHGMSLSLVSCTCKPCVLPLTPYKQDGYYRN